MTPRQYAVKDLKLAPLGRRRVEWAEQQMPVLRRIRDRFAKDLPLRGVRVAACLHLTAETANLLRTLKIGGADIAACASDPLSTHDDVAAAMLKYDGIAVFAVHGQDVKSWRAHQRAVVATNPSITIDDGAELISLLHTDCQSSAKTVLAGLEETTTGVHRLRALERSGELGIPVIAVNDADTKYLFDNRYGTGQSTIDGILRATNVLLAGRVVVIAGYGWCGKGVARRAQGMGAQVVVTEIDPIRGLEAAMEGIRVMPMREAAKLGDIFITLAGAKHVIREEHFMMLKDGAILCNSGHFDVEIDLKALRNLSQRVQKDVRPGVDGYLLRNGRWVNVIGEGRLVNLAAAEGHPAAVMDMSFATQALTAEWAVRGSRSGTLPVRVHQVPREIEELVASLKLDSMGIKIDRPTAEQRAYLTTWSEAS